MIKQGVPLSFDELPILAGKPCILTPVHFVQALVEMTHHMKLIIQNNRLRRIRLSRVQEGLLHASDRQSDLAALFFAQRLKEKVHTLLSTISAPKPSRPLSQKITDHDPVRMTFADRDFVNANHHSAQAIPLASNASTICVMHVGMYYDLESLGSFVPLYIKGAVNYRLAVGGTHIICLLMTKVIYKNAGTVIRPKPATQFMLKNGPGKGMESENGACSESNEFIASSRNTHQTFLKEGSNS